MLHIIQPGRQIDLYIRAHRCARDAETSPLQTIPRLVRQKTRDPRNPDPPTLPPRHETTLRPQLTQIRIPPNSQNQPQPRTLQLHLHPLRSQPEIKAQNPHQKLALNQRPPPRHHTHERFSNRYPKNKGHHQCHPRNGHSRRDENNRRSTSHQINLHQQYNGKRLEDTDQDNQLLILDSQRKIVHLQKGRGRSYHTGQLPSQLGRRDKSQTVNIQYHDQ